MTISFSCRCPNTDYLGFEASPDAIIQTAMKAEELGFDAVLVNDHIIVDGSPRSAAWTNTFDPFVALSFMAANTKQIGLGVWVLIVPYRNPIATAKALATLDRMSGGRLICGVGVGWNQAEFAALGVNIRERGARTNEYLRIWQACWAPGVVSFEGQFSFPSRTCTSTRSHCASRTHHSGSVARALPRFAAPRSLPKRGNRHPCLWPN
jgi:alkanesulfonate monooxygenase SsuD/methylene tetrahydromethanopterin reductase-like flavin-dependent oxidoreductase (luciferase family)